jgi:hypothetical protein
MEQHEDCIKISWKLVTDQFERHFSEIFTEKSKQKIYFGNGDNVEGPKDSWSILALADALVSLASNAPRAPMKRIFDQVDTLKRSICQVYRRGLMKTGSIALEAQKCIPPPPSPPLSHTRTHTLTFKLIYLSCSYE